MKVPLAHDPFPPVTLSLDQEHLLQFLSDTLLEETLAENDDFVVRHNRVLNKTMWKRVMVRGELAIYKRIGKGDVGGYTSDISLSEPTSRERRTKHWRVPMCVGVGTVVGSLEEVLYGALAVTKTETDIRSTYSKDDAADGRVLANVITPTEADPLRSLLVRWSLLHQLVHSFGLTPHDIVNMESIGTRVLPSGERIGYIVLQSLDVPGCGDLSHLGLIRSKFSSCYIFRDTGHGSLDVYLRGFVEPGGNLATNIALFKCCMALVAVWRLMLAGQNKKLAYAVRTKLLTRRSTQEAKHMGDMAKSCSLCLRPSSSFRSLVGCDLCLNKACSRCVDTRKLTHVKSSGTLVRVPTRICKGCLATVASMRASDIAVNEQVPDSARSIRKHDVGCTLYARSMRTRTTSASTSSSGSARPYRDTMSSLATTTRSHSVSRDSVVSSASYVSDAVSVASDPEALRRQAGGVQVAATDSGDETDWQAWLRLSELCLSDEEDMPILTTPDR